MNVSNNNVTQVKTITNSSASYYSCGHIVIFTVLLGQSHLIGITIPELIGVMIPSGYVTRGAIGYLRFSTSTTGSVWRNTNIQIVNNTVSIFRYTEENTSGSFNNDTLASLQFTAFTHRL